MTYYKMGNPKSVSMVCERHQKQDLDLEICKNLADPTLINSIV